MTNIIDRRVSEKNKNLVNKNRFLKRTKDYIREALNDKLKNKSIKDDVNENVIVTGSDIEEPTFRNDSLGTKDFILPGNREYKKGDTILSPRKSSRRGRGSGNGGMEEVEVALSQDEFLDLFFENLELPDLVKTSLKETVEESKSRSGFTITGIPSNLDIGRTFVSSMARKIALEAFYDTKIKDLEDQIPIDASRLELLKKYKAIIPFIDDVDLRYKNFNVRPKPDTSAVMFCIMDISGSMQEKEKFLSKQFFTILYLFLKKKYKNIDVIFIQHTDTAEEVVEDEFFNSQKSGGTKVSSSLEVLSDIIHERYNSSEYNIYVSQCTDGDNDTSDNDDCKNILEKKILPYIQQYCYIEISNRTFEARSYFSQETTLWNTYKIIADKHDKFNVKRVSDSTDVFSVFEFLFRKRK